MAEKLQLLLHYRARGLADLQLHIEPCHGKQVKGSHVLSQIAHKLSKVGTGLNILGNPIEACRRIPTANSLDDFRKVGIVERP